MRIYNADIVGTAGLADGAVTNVKVNAAAAIASTKLDLSAVAQPIIFSTDNARDIGDSTHQARTVYVGTSVLIGGVDVMAFAMVNAHLSQA